MSQKVVDEYAKIQSSQNKTGPDHPQSKTKDGALGISSTGKEQAVVRGKSVK